MDKFLASFEPAGLRPAEATSYLSPGYDQAERHLDIDHHDGGRRREWVE